jgi:hypothetical protein
MSLVLIYDELHAVEDSGQLTAVASVLLGLTRRSHPFQQDFTVTLVKIAPGLWPF